MWACEEIDGAAFIGSVGTFQPLDWPEPEIAYWPDQPFWRQGFATEAAAARDWLFGHFPLPRVASFIRLIIMHRNVAPNGPGRIGVAWLHL